MRLLGIALASLALAAGTATAAGSWRTVTDAEGGFSVGVPASWQVVPRSTSELNALIARHRREQRVALANQFAQIAAVRRATKTVFRFQAFAWPPRKGAVVPDVTVKTDRLTPGTTAAALPVIARQMVKAFESTAGASAAAPVALRLPAGRAMLVTGRTQLSKSVQSRFAIYILIHGRKLYSLSFRGPATPFERRVAASLRFRG